MTVAKKLMSYLKCSPLLKALLDPKTQRLDARYSFLSWDDFKFAPTLNFDGILMKLFATNNLQNSNQTPMLRRWTAISWGGGIGRGTLRLLCLDTQKAEFIYNSMVAKAHHMFPLKLPARSLGIGRWIIVWRKKVKRHLIGWTLHLKRCVV